MPAPLAPGWSQSPPRALARRGRANRAPPHAWHLPQGRARARETERRLPNWRARTACVAPRAWHPPLG
eukprot:2035324-Lingulodinium_polyedra.AAC.1